MQTFVLIHGGNHQGRHWDRLRPILAGKGNAVITPDVPMGAVDAGISGWADAVIDAIENAPMGDDVILVGHSLAGLVLPLIAARTPVRRMIFLCALMPTPGVSWTDYVAEHPEASTMPPGRLSHDELGRMTYSWEFAREVFYPDCDLADAKEAYGLIGPCAYTGITEKSPLGAWPDIPSTYILAQDDALIGPAWSRMISIERFNHPALELPGGHSPMLSRPQQLARLLEQVSRQ
jgi:pimeloyl-ACP methyl ester carboxylesterase